MVFVPFWSETGYGFNHLGLKSGKVLNTLWKRGLRLGIIFGRSNFFDVFFLCYSGLEQGGENHLVWSKIV